MTGDTVFLLDRHHLGVLFHGELKVEPVSGLIRIGQGPANQRACLYPPEKLWSTQKHIIELGVIVVNAPFLRCF